MLVWEQFLAIFIFISTCSKEDHDSLGTILGRIHQRLQQKITTAASMGTDLGRIRQRLQQKITTAASMGTDLGRIRQRLQQKITTLVSLGTVLGQSHQRLQQILVWVQFLVDLLSACSKDHNRCYPGYSSWPISSAPAAKITKDATPGTVLGRSHQRLQQRSQQMLVWVQFLAEFISACSKRSQQLLVWVQVLAEFVSACSKRSQPLLVWAQFLANLISACSKDHNRY